MSYNKTYQRIGLSDEKLNNVFSKCMEYDEKNKSSVEYHIKNKEKERTVINIFKYVAAVAMVTCVIGVGAYKLGGLVSNKTVSTDSRSNAINRDKLVDLELGDWNKDCTVDIVENEAHVIYPNNVSECISSYELFAGEWNKYYNEEALNLSSKDCYEANGDLKEGYESKRITANNSDKYIDVVGKNFITISAEQTKENSPKNRRFYGRGKQMGNFKKADEEYFSYDHVYFIQGTTLVRITCDENLSVCFDKSFSYNELILEDGKINFYYNPESVEETTTRFTDSNIYKSMSVFSLKIDGKEVEKLYGVQIMFMYDEDSDEKDVTLYYVDMDDNLWRIENVLISSKDNLVDFDKLEVLEGYEKEKMLSGFKRLGVNSEYKEFKDYCYGSDSVYVYVYDKSEIYKKTDDYKIKNVGY